MTTPPLVTADWLKANIAAPDLRVVDATWFAPFTNPPQTGREAYQAEHIPGAVFFDIDQIADPDGAFPHTFPPAHVFSARVRKLGLGDGNRIVIYDRNRFFASARAWWMLRVMGCKDVLVLDGGFEAWRAAGGEIEDLPPIAVERHFTPRVRADLIKSTDQVADIVAHKAGRVIDARPAARFAGSAPEPREGLPSGHMPGSVSLPGDQLLTSDGRMKPPAELDALFRSISIDPASAGLVTSCGSGVTAAVTALALATLGNDLVAVYDGSWTEWASRGDLPIQTGQ